MSPSSVSLRRSIRWLPGPASEPTKTIVLTGGKTGVFLDVRFLKGLNVLDWAFAGYRYKVSEDTVEFKHYIDSRTLDSLLVRDVGTNTVLEDGQVVEVGEMVNPDTGLMTQYEEIWEDAEECNTGVFIKNESGTAWQAQVGNWQLAMGRDGDGVFWAWQAIKVFRESEEKASEWEILYFTGAKPFSFLPKNVCNWTGSTAWNGDIWSVVES